MKKPLLAPVALALAFSLAACATTHSAEVKTPDQKAVMSVIDQFVAGFNAGDTKKALALCTDQMAIVDEFPPHEWHGSSALARWLEDYDVNAKKDGITDGFVKAKAARHLDVQGDYAYAVVPSDYTWKQKGKPMKEEDSLFTFALHKGPGGWKITGWAWANN
jgi:ketosteroid isomerase-like protein